MSISIQVTPNSSLETGISSNLLGSTTVSASNVISADSSVASSVSLDEDIEESPIKVKKKDETHSQVRECYNFYIILNFNRHIYVFRSSRRRPFPPRRRLRRLAMMRAPVWPVFDATPTQAQRIRQRQRAAARSDIRAPILMPLPWPRRWARVATPLGQLATSLDPVIMPIRMQIQIQIRIQKPCSRPTKCRKSTTANMTLNSLPRPTLTQTSNHTNSSSHNNSINSNRFTANI